MPVDPELVRDVIARVQALDLGARQEAIDSISDPQLREEVRSVLTAETVVGVGSGSEGGSPAGRLGDGSVLPGGTVGPFRLLQKMSEGGMGAVFRVRHRQTEEPAALKMVKVPDARLVASIRREVDALSRLDHPGIVSVLGSGLHGGMPWYAMELLDGTPLRVHLSGTRPLIGPDSETSDLAADPERTKGLASPEGGSAPREELSSEGLDRILRFGRRLCDPLSYLHGEGLVHRDLKPDNVLVRPDGSPVIIDFGLTTRFTDAVSRETLELGGLAVGTIDYMSPEQGRGELVDARSDLYALGCILYVLITGRPPFLGSPSSVLKAHRTEPPEPPSRLVAGVPAEIDQLVLSLLAKEPRDRIGFADDVARRLGAMGADTGSPTVVCKSYLYRPAFAGRRREFERLKAALGADRGGGTFLIGGESGIGKTRLVSEVVRVANARSLPILAGQALAEGGEPLQLLRGPLQSVADRCLQGDAEAKRLLGDRGPVLVLYEPALGRLPTVAAQPPPMELKPEPGRLRLYAYLRETLRALVTRQKLVVVLEDLQWADELSLGFLRYLARLGAEEDDGIVVLATFRSDEVGSALRQLLDEGLAERIDLGFLDVAAVESIVLDMLALDRAPAEFSKFLWARSKGSPFFVAEYLRAAVGEGILHRDAAGWHVGDETGSVGEYERLALPGSLHELISRRLDALPEGAARLLDAAAVLAREATGDFLQQVAGIPERDGFNAIQTLVTRQIVEESGQALRLVHGQIAQVRYAALPQEVRRDLHRAAAEALTAESAGADGSHLAERGRHWERCGETDEARRCYLAAARAATARYARDEAQRLYERYFRLCGDPTAESVEAGIELGREVFHLLGRSQEAEAQYRRVLQEARELGLADLQGKALQFLGLLENQTGRMAEADRSYREALALCRAVCDRDREGSLLAQLARLRLDEGAMEEAGRLYEQSLAIHRREGNRTREGAVLGNLASFYLNQGRIDEARDLFEQALTIHRDQGSRGLQAVVYGNLALLEYGLGNRDRARELYERALATHRAVGDRDSEGIVLLNLASLHYRQGRCDEAVDLYDESRRIFHEVGNRRAEGSVLSNLAALQMDLGERTRARELMEQALAIAREVRNRYGEGILLTNLAGLLHSQGEVEEAHAFYEEALAINLEVGNRSVEGVVRGNLARLHHSQGRLEESRAMNESALLINREAGNRLGEGAVLANLAEYHLVATGDLEAARELAEEGGSIMAGIEEKYELGRIVCVQGHVRIAAGQSAEEQVADARGIAAELGAGDGSDLVAAIAKLERAQSALRSGGGHLCGYAPTDVTAGQLKWLRVHRPELEVDC